MVPNEYNSSIQEIANKPVQPVPVPVAANIEVDVVVPQEANQEEAVQEVVQDFGKDAQEAAQEVEDAAQEVLDKVEDVPAPTPETNDILADAPSGIAPNEGGELPSTNPVAAEDSDEYD